MEEFGDLFDLADALGHTLKLERIHCAGHIPPLTWPELVNPVIAQYLDRM